MPSLLTRVALATAFIAPLSATAADDLYDLGYGIGVLMQQRALQEFSEVPLDAIIDGLRDARAGGELTISAEQAGTMMRDYVQAQSEIRAAAAAEEGQAYLAENGARDGVTTTDSGLQYEVLTAGNDERPSATSQVTVHYRGTLLSGEEFDSSYSRGEPASFGLNQVIPGWTEGVQLMGVGAKYRFVIPSELAYGQRGAGGNIGPDETLIFEVELISIDG